MVCSHGCLASRGTLQVSGSGWFNAGRENLPGGGKGNEGGEKGVMSPNLVGVDRWEKGGR